MASPSLLTFTLIISAAIIIPGPTVLLALNNAAYFGMRRAMIGILGAATADIVLISFVGFSLDLVLSTSDMLFIGLKCIGAAWLAYIGIKMLQSTGKMDDGSVEVIPSSYSLLAKSFFLAISNPKYYLFLTAILSQFVNPTIAAAPQYVQLIIITVAVDVVIMMGYALLGWKSVRMWNENGIKWMSRISGSFLIVLAGSIFIT